MARVKRIAAAAELQEVFIASGKGRARRSATAPTPIPSYVRPGDAVFDAIGGGKAAWWMVVDWSFSCVQGVWKSSPTVVALSDADRQDLGKVRKKHLKRAGYL